ncbi:MAG: 50S ribosome-binding GTPase [Deltaproteobacteria bacterium]|nr:50S ribosome-binding GTPase [Deltaproteobacteria bacterium]
MHNHIKTKPLPHLKKVVLIGNPNVGKSLIFGYLTGRYATVSNYPGTTVEITLGDLKTGSETISLIDTPGINSLTPISEDERVVRDILLKENISSVIQVMDAKNLERGLYITTQVAEMGLPTLIVLNMMDEAQARGVDINIAALSKRLGVPIVPTIAIQRKGIERIKKEIQNSCIPQVWVPYSQTVEESLDEIEEIMPNPHFSRFIGLSILSGDRSLKENLISSIPKNKLSFLDQLHHFSQLSSKEYPISYFIGLKRLELAKDIAQKVSATSFKSGSQVLETLGRILRL